MGKFVLYDYPILRCQQVVIIMLIDNILMFSGQEFIDLFQQAKSIWLYKPESTLNKRVLLVLLVILVLFVN
jgi:hypothetical protein